MGNRATISPQPWFSELSISFGFEGWEKHEFLPT